MSKKHCSAKNHVGCGAYKANLENLANLTGSTPEKVEQVLKNSLSFKEFSGCWGYFTNQILKNPPNIEILKSNLKQT